jgi:hypothetical protein
MSCEICGLNIKKGMCCGCKKMDEMISDAIELSPYRISLYLYKKLLIAMDKANSDPGTLKGEIQ